MAEVICFIAISAWYFEVVYKLHQTAIPLRFMPSVRLFVMLV
jgi:hypothetical protein